MCVGGSMDIMRGENSLMKFGHYYKVSEKWDQKERWENIMFMMESN